MAEEKRKTLKQLEKEAGPLIPVADDPENKFLSKAQFIAKQEKKKARELAIKKAGLEYDKEQTELEAKRKAAEAKAGEKAADKVGNIKYAIKKGKKVLKTFDDKDEAFVADHKDSDSLKVIEQ